MNYAPGALLFLWAIAAAGQAAPPAVTIFFAVLLFGSIVIGKRRR